MSSGELWFGITSSVFWCVLANLFLLQQKWFIYLCVCMRVFFLPLLCLKSHISCCHVCKDNSAFNFSLWWNARMPDYCLWLSRVAAKRKHGFSCPYSTCCGRNQRVRNQRAGAFKTHQIFSTNSSAAKANAVCRAAFYVTLCCIWK